MTVAVLLALACAATFAVSTSVQHQAAGNVPESASGLFQLLAHLVRNPLWLLGQFLATCAFALHALALHAGALAVVQPLVVSGIVWAVPARAAMSRRMPSLGEIRAVVLTASGLAVFLVASNPSEGRMADRGWSSGILALGVVVIAALASAVAEGIGDHPRQRAFFLGVTAGALFGLVAGLLKMSLQTYADGGINLLVTTWPVWGLLAAGAGGVLTNQRAYRVASLSASMPVLNIVNVLTALTFGLTVFNEIPRHSPPILVVEVLALGAVAMGLWLLVHVEADFIDHPSRPEDPSSRNPTEADVR
jgi:drug/metabolite transporter (DMT)-like permease